MAAHSTEALQQRFGIPDVVRFEDGPNGLVRVRVTAPAAEAEIYLHGGHVTHYQPRGGRSVLFVSARSRYDAKSAIRGGVPVIFPWFGAKADDRAAPQHGFVRAAAWDVESVERVGPDAVALVLRVDASEATRAVWPHRFVLRHRIGIGAALDLVLEVDNGSAEPILFEEALHTYLAVGDVREASVTGLAGTTYIDKTDGMTRKRQGPEPLRLAGETDSVYVSTRATCVVDDPVGRRRLVVEKEGSDTTVVWNPWATKARALSDLGADEWPGMVCIETANAADNRVTLAPGGCHRMRATIRTEPR
jgi:glucose-6-phosphate 1-epimerase